MGGVFRGAGKPPCHHGPRRGHKLGSTSAGPRAEVLLVHSWVFRNRARLQAIYGRLQPDQRPGTGVFRNSETGQSDDLAVFELFPLPRPVYRAS